MDTEFVPALAPTVRRAAVLAASLETPYLRAGSGAPVLLLSAEPSRCPLLPALAVGFRVIAPETGGAPRQIAALGPGPGFATWLRDFLDGLGAGCVAVVAEAEFAVPALFFALLEPERIERLALLLPRPDAPDPVPAALTDLLRRTGQPLLIAQPEAGRTAVARFLTAAAPPP